MTEEEKAAMMAAAVRMGALSGPAAAAAVEEWLDELANLDASAFTYRVRRRRLHVVDP